MSAFVDGLRPWSREFAQPVMLMRIIGPVTIGIVIIGAGGFGREVRDWFMQFQDVMATDTTVKLLGFLDDGTPDPERLRRIGAVHLGPVSSLHQLDAMYYVAVGDPATRREIVQRCERLGATPAPALVHPSAVCGSDVDVGIGTVICPMAVITTNVRVGAHVHLNLTTTVGHDTVIGDFVTVNPGATISGDVTLEEGVMIGTGASINQGLTIGAASTVGAGAAVVKDIPAGITAVGVPAKAR